ncbi:conserved membrane protein of unknown function [Pseudodesulfovibrio profundus]|uniref:O-antigen polymerase n=2 Tax=Pseudodesulfovibrio profundus TaxID=57320 RepID=A0A2C8F8I7_9BACT|nr:conserved membrane protein of unknown function [Pseudodesulfovibrio profundus]
MNSVMGISSSRNRLSAVPLAAAYVAVPMGMAMVRLVDGQGAYLENLPWLLLAGLGVLIGLHRPSPDAPRSTGFTSKTLLFLCLVAGLALYTSDIRILLETVFPYIREFAPVAYALFALLWAGTCGMADRYDFQRFGALLSVICIVNLVFEVFMYGTVPTIRWIGNADILAGLLLISLCAGLKPGLNEGGRVEPDQGNTWWRVLVLIGLLTCFSRTGYFAAGWIVLCFGRGRLLMRSLYALVCALLLVVTFLLPPTASESIRYVDYWLWVEALRLFSETPSLLLTGYPLNIGLPVTFPPGMTAIWETATGQPTIMGVYLTQVPSFWLRLLYGWGATVPAALLVFVFTLLFKNLSRMGAGLTAALFAQGMTTPLLFDPAMAVPIVMGYMVALSSPADQANAKVDEPDGSKVQPLDPAAEWNMRPL